MSITNSSKKLVFIVSFNFLFSLVICSKVGKKFKQAKIVPDLILKPPHRKIQITYDNKYVVQLGNSLSPIQVENAPTTVKYNASSKHYYLLIMIDPDFQQFIHWCIGNIPGDDITKGEEVAPYFSPIPPHIPPPHRYTFLVYKQPEIKKIKFDLIITMQERNALSLDETLKKYHIDYNSSQYGNFFTSQG